MWKHWKRLGLRHLRHALLDALMTMIKHWTRLWASIIGTYDRSHPLWPKGRQSLYRGYWFELGHSLKNIPVEYLRHWGIWDRGDKNGIR